MKKQLLLSIWGVLLAVCFFVNPVFAEAGWDNGFYIKSDDGQFKMKIGGKVQLQEKVQRISGLQKTATKAGTRSTKDADPFTNSFLLRRGQLITSGTVFEKLDWSTIIHASTGSSGTNILWFADFTYNFTPYLRVTGGTVQIPMDRMQDNSSTGLLFIEHPLTATQADGFKFKECRNSLNQIVSCSDSTVATTKDVATIGRDAFGLPFDLGVRIDGDIGSRFSYALGVGNGSGFNQLNTNNELTYGVRGQVNIMDSIYPGSETDFERSEKPKLSFGFGTGFEDTDIADENVPTIQRKWSWTGSGDIAFRYLGFSLNSEIYYRVVKLSAKTSIEDTNRDAQLKDFGYYGNIGYYFIPKKLEGVLMAAQIFREGRDNNSNEFGGGLNWYIHKNKVKWQIDYTNILDYDDVEGLNNAKYHRVRTMFSVFL